MTLEMYDSIEVSTVPGNAAAVAGYVGGRWPTYAGLVQKFPHAHHLSIAISSSEDAEALDIEQGDATPAAAPAWVKRQHARGVSRPVVYASLAAMHNVLTELANAGIGRDQVRVWTAHYTGRPHLCSPSCGFNLNTTADATQWTDAALGRNLDESLVEDSFFPGVAKDVPPAAGIPQFAGELNLQNGRWKIAGQPGWFRASPKGGVAAARITFDERTGAWSVRPLPWLVKVLTRK